MTDLNTNPSNLPADHPNNPANQAPVVPVVQPTPVVAPTTTATPVAPVVVPDTPIGTYGGSTAMDTALSIFAGQTGVTPDKFGAALSKALEYGDESLIDIGTLTAGLKPDQVAQAAALAKAAYQETRADIQRQTQEAHTLAGGEAQWKEATAVFNTKAPEHIRAVVRTMLESGDVKNAAQFVLDTVRGSGMVTNGTPPITGGSSVPTQGTSEAEFRVVLAEIERSAGNRSLESGAHAIKFQQAVAARNLGRKQGR